MKDAFQHAALWSITVSSTALYFYKSWQFKETTKALWKCAKPRSKQNKSQMLKNSLENKGSSGHSLETVINSPVS